MLDGSLISPQKNNLLYLSTPYKQLTYYLEFGINLLLPEDKVAKKHVCQANLIYNDRPGFSARPLIYLVFEDPRLGFTEI